MTESFDARGFGPGLPAEGAPVRLHIAGERLRIEDWPEVRELRKAMLQARHQGDGLMLEWEGSGGSYAILVSKVGAGATALAAWLPAAALPPDRATASWLWAALFLVLGLPLLLLAVFFGFRAQIVDGLVALVPVEQEQALADQLWKMQSIQLKLIPDNVAQRFVEDVGAKLVAAHPTPYTYRFHLADDKTVNAFAMPAGYIVVNRGLIEKAKSAEEVAGVLAHEIEHVEQRHALRGMVQTLGFHALWLAVTGDIGGGLAGDGLRQLAGLHFSREQESAADAGGYARLIAAKIDPHGMASFFEKLAKENAEVPELLSSHPASAERAARLTALMKDAPAFPPLAVDWAAVQGSLKNTR